MGNIESTSSRISTEQLSSIQNTSTDTFKTDLDDAIDDLSKAINDTGKQIAEGSNKSIENRISIGKQLSNKLAEVGNTAKKIFSKIFSAFKDIPRMINSNNISKTVVNDEIEKEQYQLNLVKLRSTKLLHYGSKLDEKTGESIPNETQTGISMPDQFVRDLLQPHTLTINGQALFSSSLETVETKVNRMIEVLGDTGATAAARLLNQKMLTSPTEVLGQLTNGLWGNADGQSMEFEIEVKGENVTLSARQIVTLKHNNEEKSPNVKKFVGIEVKTNISLTELKRLGSLKEDKNEAALKEEVGTLKKNLYVMKNQLKTKTKDSEKDDTGDVKKLKEKIAETEALISIIDDQLDPKPMAKEVKIERCSYRFTDICTNVQKAKNKLTPPLEPFSVEQALDDTFGTIM